MSDFDTAVNVVLDNEGPGYITEDNGRGPSRWGVTLLTLQEFEPSATADTILDLTKEEAAEFYRRAFWDAMGIGRIEDQGIATRLLDLGVNIGGGTAVGLLQLAVGVRKDGILGPVTAATVNSRPSPEVLTEFHRQAAGYYHGLVQRYPNLSGNLSGWLNRLNT